MYVIAQAKLAVLLMVSEFDAYAIGVISSVWHLQLIYLHVVDILAQ